MAARGLQETYRSRLRFSALRMARITLESEEADSLRGGSHLKGGVAQWMWTSGLTLYSLVVHPDVTALHSLYHPQMEATYAGRRGVGPGWQQASGRPVCSPGQAPGPRPSHSGTRHCSTLQIVQQACWDPGCSATQGPLSCPLRCPEAPDQRCHRKLTGQGACSPSFPVRQPQALWVGAH